MDDRSPIASSKVEVFTGPTDPPEADGTFAWDSTTMVPVQLQAGDKTALGYTYADAGTGKFVEGLLRKAVDGKDAFSQAGIGQAMISRCATPGSFRLVGEILPWADSRVTLPDEKDRFRFVGGAYRMHPA